MVCTKFSMVWLWLVLYEEGAEDKIILVTIVTQFMVCDGNESSFAPPLQFSLDAGW